MTHLPDNIAKRRDAIIGAVQRGEYEARYMPWSDTHEVMADALKLTDVTVGDLTVPYVRVGVSHEITQTVCSLLGLTFPTAEDIDEMWHRADIQCPPKPFKNRPEALLDVRYDDHVDSHIGRRFSGLITGWKHWLQDGANYGWHATRETYRGKLYPSADGRYKVIQRRSRAHNRYHMDYSQKLQLLRPLDRSVPPWRDPCKTLGERAVAYSLAELEAGVSEQGHNAGPRIAEYFAPATRLIGGKEVKLGLKSGNWCVAAAMYAEQQSLLPGEQLTLPYRVSGIEVERDAAALGIWRSVDEVRQGGYSPKVGDLVVWHRGDMSSWTRHVGRVYETVVDGKFTTIDGNQGPRWMVRQRRMYDSTLRGFVEYPERVNVCQWRQWQLVVDAVANYVRASGDSVADWLADVRDDLVG